MMTCRNGERQRAAERQERRVVSGRACGDPQNAPHEQRVHQGNHEDTDESELLSNHRNDEIRLPGRNQVAVPHTRARAKTSTRCERPQSVCDLIATRPCVVPGIQPDRDAPRERCAGRRASDQRQIPR